MRLYLSSERLGKRAGAMLAEARPDERFPRVAVIANGYDGASAMARDFYRTEIYDLIAEFTALDLDPAELDLRAHFGDAASLRRCLRGYDLVWVMGGNSFALRRAMKQSGFDTVVRDLLETDAIAYGGYAAGAVVADPTRHGLDLMDDPYELPEGYDDPPIWSGLGLAPFVIAPHDRSQHPEAAAAEKVVSYIRARRSRFRAIFDGEVIVETGRLEKLAS